MDLSDIITHDAMCPRGEEWMLRSMSRGKRPSQDERMLYNAMDYDINAELRGWPWWKPVLAAVALLSLVAVVVVAISAM